MKLIELPVTLPDGRVATYHRVTEITVSFSTPATAVVLLGSWVKLDGATSQSRADAVSALEMPNEQSVFESLLERVLSLPEWSAGRIIDFNEAPQPTATPIIYDVDQELQ